MIKLDETSKEFEEIENGWYEEVKTINTKRKLKKFVKKIICGYEHDYGTYIHAVAVCTKAFIRLYGGGMSGLQANFLMWLLIRKTFGVNDEFGLQLVRYESVLYPQLLESFKTEIDSETHDKIIAKAKELIAQDDKDEKKAVKEVRKHWEKLATGWLPRCITLIAKPKKENAK